MDLLECEPLFLKMKLLKVVPPWNRPSKTQYFDKFFDMGLHYILLEIFRDLPPLDLASCRGVCQRWRNFVDGEVLGNTKLAKKRKLKYSHDVGDIARQLIDAVLGGNHSYVRRAIVCPEIDINTMDTRGMSSLSWAVSFGRYDLVKMLLRRKDIDVNQRVARRLGVTPLISAVKCGSVPIFSMLVRRKELLVNDCSGRSGETALLAACYAPNPNIAEEIVRALLTRKDIDVNYPDTWDATPLLTATCMGYDGIVRLLVERDDVDVNKASKDGLTPIFRAVACEQDDILDMLLARHDIDVNVAIEGVTPLMEAARLGRTDYLEKFLAKEKIEVNKKNQDGTTALKIALETNNKEVSTAIVDWLRASERKERDRLSKLHKYNKKHHN